MTIETTLPHSERFRVRYSDTDRPGSPVFCQLHGVRRRGGRHYLEELGYPAMTPDRAPALCFTVNINCDYVDECGSGDEVLVSVGYQRLGKSSAVLAYELREGQRPPDAGQRHPDPGVCGPPKPQELRHPGAAAGRDPGAATGIGGGGRLACSGKNR